MNRILLATDFSACAARAQQYAFWLAQTLHRRLAVLHVLEFMPGMDPLYAVNQVYLGDLEADARKHFARIEAEAAAISVEIEFEQRLGIPSEKINAVAVERGAELIVLGTHGRTGLEHIVLGSTAERVVRGAPCPVWCVRGPRGTGTVDAYPAPGVRHILLAMDFSDCAAAALRYAGKLASALNAAVTVLHVIEPVSYGLDFTLTHAAHGAAVREAAEHRLSQVAGPLKNSGHWRTPLVRAGLPADTILETAAAIRADLIVMGTHGRRGVSHLMSGSVAEAVLRKSECPVMTVRQGQ